MITAHTTKQFLEQNTCGKEFIIYNVEKVKWLYSPNSGNIYTEHHNI